MRSDRFFCRLIMSFCGTIGLLPIKEVKNGELAAAEVLLDDNGMKPEGALSPTPMGVFSKLSTCCSKWYMLTILSESNIFNFTSCIWWSVSVLQYWNIDWIPSSFRTCWHSWLDFQIFNTIWQIQIQPNYRLLKFSLNIIYQNSHWSNISWIVN